MFYVHPDEIEAITRECAAVGNNLNQIAAFFNSGGIQSRAMHENINHAISCIFEMREQVADIFEQYKPEIVVNLGAQAGVRYSITNPDAYVEANLIGFYTERITLDDLAERFFINKFYLSKIFRETYGTTVNNYLISKRITRAKQLLRFTDMTVDEVGVAVGMGDANYFSRMFRKVEGISPREYRKQW